MGKSRCTEPIYGKAKFCIECKKQRNKILHLRWYHKHKPKWKPRNVKCRCGETFKITDRKQCNAKKCPSCRAKPRVQNSKTAARLREDFNSTAKRTECRCPTCGGTHYRKLDLYDPQKRYKNKPFPKRCHPCDAIVSRDDVCPVSGAHHIGVI